MLNKLIKIVRNAGKIIDEQKFEKLRIDYKDDKSIITQIDILVNTYINDELSKTFPGIFILAEESVKDSNVDTFFAVDPIDGTAEFVKYVESGFENKYAEFSIQLGYVENNIPQIGIVFMPAIDRIYYAELGKGAFVEHLGKKEQIFTKNSGKIIIGKYNVDDDLKYLLEKKYFTQLEQVNVGGGFGVKVCYIAEGKYDTFVHTNDNKNKIHASLWDCCGPDVILKEAGGRSYEVRTLEAVKYDLSKIELTNGYIATSNRNEKILVFDIDATLANFDKLLEHRNDEFIKQISLKRKLSLEKSKELFFETKIKLKGQNKHSTIDTMKHLNFTNENFYDMMNNVDIEGRIMPMNNVVETLRELSKKYKLIALTNTPYLATIKTLNYIGVFDYFEKIYSIDKDNFIKPSSEIFEKILKDFNVKTGYSIGDSVVKDLIPAKEVGFKTILFDMDGVKYNNDEFVDFKINDLKELLSIIK